MSISEGFSNMLGIIIATVIGVILTVWLIKSIVEAVELNVAAKRERQQNMNQNPNSQFGNQPNQINQNNQQNNN